MKKFFINVMMVIDAAFAVAFATDTICRICWMLFGKNVTVTDLTTGESYVQWIRITNPEFMLRSLAVLLLTIVIFVVLDHIKTNFVKKSTKSEG